MIGCLSKPRRGNLFIDNRLTPFFSFFGGAAQAISHSVVNITHDPVKRLSQVRAAEKRKRNGWTLTINRPPLRGLHWAAVCFLLRTLPGSAAQSTGELDPSAWGSDHVGKALPEFITSDECLFCHRAK